MKYLGQVINEITQKRQNMDKEQYFYINAPQKCNTPYPKIDQRQKIS